MTDLISRQAAIETSLEFLVEYLGGALDEEMQKRLKAKLENLPSANQGISAKDIVNNDVPLPKGHGRFIDADAEVAKIQKEIERLKQKIKNHEPDRYDGWIDHDAQIKHYETEIKDAEREIRMLNQYPAADVKPVMRGEWLHDYHYGMALPEHKCSVCGEWEYSDTESNFCPNCGADMRESEGDMA